MTDDKTNIDFSTDPRHACDEIDSRLLAIEHFDRWGFGKLRQLVAMAALLSENRRALIDQDVAKSLGEMAADATDVLNDIMAQIDACRDLARTGAGKESQREPH